MSSKTSIIMVDPVKKFKKEEEQNIARMASDFKLQKVSKELMKRSQGHHYSYHFRWFGRPIIQWPQDIVAMQEIIWSVKPDLIIEAGIAHGGSLIFYASMLELLGRGKVVGVDIEIRPHNKKAIYAHPMHKRITLIEGSSIDNGVISKVAKIAKKYKKVLVTLDSMHTHDHVLKELHAYSRFVSKGSYLVIFDTAIEDFPKGYFRDRPWDKGNNPKTAVAGFLLSNKNFIVDQTIDQKLLLTTNPGGYLKRIA